MAENPPANAGHVGPIPNPGKSHMPRNNLAREPQLLSSCSRGHVPREASVPRLEQPQLEISPHGSVDPAQP